MVYPQFSISRLLKVGGLLFALFLNSCSHGQKQTPSQLCPQNTDLKMEDRLFFGGDIPEKGGVRPKIFQDFLDKKVTPEFPEGFSILKVQGQWKYKTGKIQKEPSWVIDLLYLPTKRREESIQKIIKFYKEMFHQEAVLRLHTSICASFL